MARKTKWTEDKRKDLLDFFKKEMGKGNTSVNQNAKEYAKTNDDFTPSQIRVAYYKFANEKKYADNAARRKSTYSETTKINPEKEIRTENKYKNGHWTHKENMELLDAVKNKGYDSLLEVFSQYSQKTGRSPKNISQHYYILKNQEEYNTTKKEKEIVQTISSEHNIPILSVPQQLNLLKELMSLPHETIILIAEIAKAVSKIKINQ